MRLSSSFKLQERSGELSLLHMAKRDSVQAKTVSVSHPVRAVALGTGMPSCCLYWAAKQAFRENKITPQRLRGFHMIQT